MNLKPEMQELNLGPWAHLECLTLTALAQLEYGESRQVSYMPPFLPAYSDSAPILLPVRKYLKCARHTIFQVCIKK